MDLQVPWASSCKPLYLGRSATVFPLMWPLCSSWWLPQLYFMCSERWDWGWNPALLVSQDKLSYVPSSWDDEWPSTDPAQHVYFSRLEGFASGLPCSNAGLPLGPTALKWKRTELADTKNSNSWVNLLFLFYEHRNPWSQALAYPLWLPAPWLQKILAPRKEAWEMRLMPFLCQHVNYV